MKRLLLLLFFSFALVLPATAKASPWDGLVNLYEILADLYHDSRQQLRDYRNSSEYREYLREYRIRHMEVDFKIEVIQPPRTHSSDPPCKACEPALDLAQQMSEILQTANQGQEAPVEMINELQRLESLILLYETMLPPDAPCSPMDIINHLPLEQARDITQDELRIVLQSDLPVTALSDLQIRDEEEQKWIQYFFAKIDDTPVVIRIDVDKQSNNSRITIFRIRGLSALASIGKIQYLEEQQREAQEAKSPSATQEPTVYGPAVSTRHYNEESETELKLITGIYATSDEFLDRGPTFFEFEANKKRGDSQLEDENNYEDENEDENQNYVYEARAVVAALRSEGHIRFYLGEATSDSSVTLTEYSRLSLDSTLRLPPSETGDSTVLSANQVFYLFDRSDRNRGSLSLSRDLPRAATRASLGMSHKNLEDYEYHVSLTKAVNSNITVQAGINVEQSTPRMWLNGRIRLD